MMLLYLTWINVRDFLLCPRQQPKFCDTLAGLGVIPRKFHTFRTPLLHAGVGITEIRCLTARVGVVKRAACLIPGDPERW